MPMVVDPNHTLHHFKLPFGHERGEFISPLSLPYIRRDWTRGVVEKLIARGASPEYERDGSLTVLSSFKLSLRS